MPPPPQDNNLPTPGILGANILSKVWRKSVQRGELKFSSVPNWSITCCPGVREAFYFELICYKPFSITSTFHKFQVYVFQTVEWWIINLIFGPPALRWQRSFYALQYSLLKYQPLNICSPFCAPFLVTNGHKSSKHSEFPLPSHSPFPSRLHRDRCTLPRETRFQNSRRTSKFLSDSFGSEISRHNKGSE